MAVFPDQIFFDAFPEGNFIIPSALPTPLFKYLTECCNLPNVRNEELIQLKEAFEASDNCTSYKYFQKPASMDDKEWLVVRQLLIHKNTTKIAARTLTSGVYGGTITRKISGTGNHLDDINAFASSIDYGKSMRSHFVNSILYGTSIASPILNDDKELETYLFDPVRTFIHTDPFNVKKPQAIVEFDSSGGFMRFQTVYGSGIIKRGQPVKDGEISIYTEPMSSMFCSIAYGEEATYCGQKYGNSILKPTLSYNRILSMAYFNINMLIRWANKSLLFITTPQPDDFQKRMTDIGGNLAFVLGENSRGEFIKPSADFNQMIAFINSNLSFLAVLLGIPRSVFQPSDNQSAESARLEGSPLTSQVKQLATEFAQYETDFLYKTLSFLHYQDGESLTTADLKNLYQVNVKIRPFFETESIAIMTDAMIRLADANLREEYDIIQSLNPEYSDEQIQGLIEEREADKLSNNVPDPEEKPRLVAADQMANVGLINETTIAEAA